MNDLKSQKIRKAVSGWVEQLERRQLFAQISLTDFSSTTGLALNGYGSSSTTSSNRLVLTDALSEARSALYATKVPTHTFTAHFTYQSDAASNAADGFTFVIDNGATTDLGGLGQYFGYTGANNTNNNPSATTFGTNSVALAFDLYNNMQGGTYFGSGTGGAQINAATNASPMDLHSGDKYDFTVTYDGTNLVVTGVDETDSTKTFTNSQQINLASVLGTESAYVGFTGATGFETSNQYITAFNYTGTAATAAAPTITTAASANPTTVTGTKGRLTVGAQSNSGGTLTYNWTVTHTPPGAATPHFSVNNSTDPTTTAQYFKDGTYNFLVTATDSNGGSTSSIVQVVVQQTATAVKLLPHKAQIKVGTTDQFTGTILDQFSRALRTQPTLTYSVQTGSGSIDATTGLYTADKKKGHLVIAVEGDDLTGIAGATVIA